MWWHCRCNRSPSHVHLCISIAIAFVLALVAPAHAGAPTDALKGHVDQVVKICRSFLRDRPSAPREGPQDRRGHLRLSRHGAPRARAALECPHPGAAAGIREAFSEILDRSYGSKIELYQGERVQYVGETIDGSEATVKTMIVTKAGTEVPVDYRLHRKDGRWLVYDVIIEGMSLVRITARSSTDRADGGLRIARAAAAGQGDGRAGGQPGAFADDR